MKANEQDKIYCRSIRPDGYGEGVVPERDMINIPVVRGYDEKGKIHNDWQKWLDQKEYLASLPVLYLIHPDLHKGRIGWVGECREQLQKFYNPEWRECTQKVYDHTTKGQRRIVLVPVEGKAEENKPRCEKELHVIKYFGLPEDVSFNKVPKVTYADLVDLLFSWDETVKAKPTPATGEAGELEEITGLPVSVQAAIDGESIECVKKHFPDNDGKVGTVSRMGNLSYFFAKGAVFGYKLSQAASRTSDAVEFAEWLGNNYNPYYDGEGSIYWSANLREKNYTTAELYQLFLQSKSPNPNK